MFINSKYEKILSKKIVGQKIIPGDSWIQGSESPFSLVIVVGG